jgi:hypothetical protein
MASKELAASRKSAPSKYKFKAIRLAGLACSQRGFHRLKSKHSPSIEFLIRVVPKPTSLRRSKA